MMKSQTNVLEEIENHLFQKLTHIYI